MKSRPSSYSSPTICLDSGLSLDVVRKCIGGGAWSLRLEVAWLEMRAVGLGGRIRAVVKSSQFSGQQVFA